MKEFQPHLLSIFKSTYGILFLGCPHRGSNDANWGLIAAKLATFALQAPSKALLRSLQVDNQMLNVINESFNTYLKDNRIQVTSFSEEKGMIGIAGIDNKVCLS